MAGGALHPRQCVHEVRQLAEAVGLKRPALLGGEKRSVRCYEPGQLVHLGTLLLAQLVADQRCRLPDCGLIGCFEAAPEIATFMQGHARLPQAIAPEDDQLAAYKLAFIVHPALTGFCLDLSRIASAPRSKTGIQHYNPLKLSDFIHDHGSACTSSQNHKGRPNCAACQPMSPGRSGPPPHRAAAPPPHRPGRQNRRHPARGGAYP